MRSKFRIPNSDFRISGQRLAPPSSWLLTIQYRLKMLTMVMPDLKARLGIPGDAAYFYAMLFGMPAVRYARTVQRDDAATIRNVKSTAQGKGLPGEGE